MLLCYMDEETSFWALAVILEVLLPDYHVNSMIGLHMDCAVILTLIADEDKNLYQHLKSTSSFAWLSCSRMSISWGRCWDEYAGFMHEMVDDVFCDVIASTERLESP